ncbi:MAG: hypothetical protein SGJ15_09500 [Bacteroidota bacterium]|nr:hypothetical protein [Bacteroidota bacterium]
MKKIILITLFINFAHIKAQSPGTRFKDGLKIYLNDDSTCYIKGTGLAQIWFRYNDNNPGSTIFGTPKRETFDVGLRRVRYQILAQITNKVFFYTQFGINNQNNISARKSQLFFHDVTAEYDMRKGYLVIGGGLSGWNGTARYSSSSVASILALDLPMVQETTNDVSDEFVRRLGIYAKGKLGKFDYRLSVANPFPVQTTTTIPGGVAVAALPATGSNVAYYSTKAPQLNYQGYFMWQFFDKESNLMPYMNGSYLGKKRVFNIGMGFAHQKNAMWYRNGVGDTISKPLQQFGVDIFLDHYLNKEQQTAITLYTSFLNYNFGPNYIRNAGAMNTANGTSGTAATFNGAGNAFPLIGTGQVIYTQAAYLFKKDLFEKQGTLQPYASFIYANYQKLNVPMFVYDVGVNWIIASQNSKISLDYQSRPIFKANANGEIAEVKNARRGQVVLQYQVTF